MGAKAIRDLLQDTFREWNKDQAPTLGAALAYFTIFSLAPLIIIAIAVAGLVFGQQAASGALFGQIEGIVGEEAARTIQAMIASADKPSAGIIGTIAGTVTLLIGASGVFGQLKHSLNIIWDAQPQRGGGIARFIKDKFLSFTMVLGIGFLLLVSLVLSALMSAFGGLLSDALPGLGVLLRALNFVVSLGVVTLLFAMIFKVLPDVTIPWADVWLGAAITALLFTIGKELIGLYIGLSNVGSAYGAAGSLVVILVWIYYSTLILFFGAELAHVYANKRRSQGAPPGSVATLGEEEAPGPGEKTASGAPPQASPSATGLRHSSLPPQQPAVVTVVGYGAVLLAAALGAIAGAARLRRA